MISHRMLKEGGKKPSSSVTVVKTPSYVTKIRPSHMAKFSVEDSLFLFFFCEKDFCVY